MSNYIEFNDKIAFHPGYYIKEIIEDIGLTQEDFAKRLDTTPKNLSLLIRGEQNLSIDIAMKLSRMMDTSVIYWLNLQKAYDALVAETKSEEIMEEERILFKNVDYSYFRDYFELPNLDRKKDEQIMTVRRFLKIASLTVLKQSSMSVSFRSASSNLSEINTIKANMMVQIATNIALDKKSSCYDKKEFERAVDYALSLTDKHDRFLPLIKDAFEKAGVILVVMPNMPGSKINGAAKKIGNKIMIMVNDRGLYADNFWFTLFHEIGHVMKGDFGISFEKEKGDAETEADEFASEKLIPEESYQKFIIKRRFTPNSVRSFAKEINRDAGIVIGRLFHDELIERNNYELNSMRKKYKVVNKKTSCTSRE